MKSREEILKAIASFKRSNKERKQKIAEKNGFSNKTSYLDYLNQELRKTEEVVESKKTTKKSTKKVTTKVDDSIVDFVFVFDVTGSMASYLNAVKAHVKSLIPGIFKNNPNARVSVVATGDYCDMTDLRNMTFGDAYQVIDLTNNEQALMTFITNARSTGGGDSDEFYELVIKKVVEETSWRENSSKNVMLIADANPHKVGYSYGAMKTPAQIDWRAEAYKAAEKGIKIDTLSIAGEKWYEELAQITGGICIPFKQREKTTELLEAVTLARGGSSTNALFKERMAATSDDKDLSVVYSMYKDIIE